MDQKRVGAIKGWAIIIGVLSLANLVTLSVYPILSPVGIVATVAIILGFGVLYVGLQVTSLSLKTVSSVFWAKFIWLIVNFLYSVSLGDLDFIRLLILLAQVVIVWYLIQNLKKLSQPVQIG